MQPLFLHPLFCDPLPLWCGQYIFSWHSQRQIYLLCLGFIVFEECLTQLMILTCMSIHMEEERETSECWVCLPLTARTRDHGTMWSWYPKCPHPVISKACREKNAFRYQFSSYPLEKPLYCDFDCCVDSRIFAFYHFSSDKKANSFHLAELDLETSDNFRDSCSK